MIYEEDIMEQSPAQIIALNWAYKFNETHLTEDDLKQFAKECKEAGVTALDVYEYM